MLSNRDTTVRKIIPYYVAFCWFAAITSSFITTIITHDKWIAGDWLINYEGGFVRRGIIGQVIYELSELTAISPGTFVFLILLSLFSLYYYCINYLLKKQEHILPYVFLVFAPFTLAFQVSSPEDIRKPAICYALLALTIVFTHKLSKKHFNIFFYALMMIGFPIVLLAHEATMIFVPYFLIAYLYVNKVTVKSFITMVAISIPAAIVFLGVIIFARYIPLDPDVDD